MARHQYKKRPNFHVTAVQIDLNCDGFTYHKWGNPQKCRAGDWLVNNAGDTYTVEKAYFADHYQLLRPGLYEKVGAVWAEQAPQDGAIETLEGMSNYLAGDYLVYDRPSGGDAYAVNKNKFENMYELQSEPGELSDTQRDYIEQRVKPERDWFDRKARKNRVNYYLWQTLTIITAALVPVFSSVDEPNGVLIAFLGGASAIFAGFLSLFKFQENWVKYRSTCEDLKSHLAQFSVFEGAYHNKHTAFALLVENCERILGAERGQWMQRVHGVAEE